MAETEGTTTEVAETETPSEVVEDTAGAGEDIIVPIVVTTTFTIQLSYGTVLVTVEQDDQGGLAGATIETTAGGSGGVVVSSNNGALNDLLLPAVGVPGGGTRQLTAAERNVIRTAILGLPGAPDGVVVNVPNNPIFVSPSS